jgi:AmmeMemoRadiSam system protein A
MEENVKLCLLTSARKTIADHLGVDWSFYSNKQLFDCKSKELDENKGTFVTLTINGDLRGCIGQIIPDKPISQTIKENAISAAIKDPRFPPMNSTEFNKVSIELSILSKPEELKYDGEKDLLDKIKQNEHGLIIRLGIHSSTFLPQVWEELCTKEEFLSHLCMKAGLYADEWKKGNLEVSTYTVEHFSEKDLDLAI